MIRTCVVGSLHTIKITPACDPKQDLKTDRAVDHGSWKNHGPLQQNAEEAFDDDGKRRVHQKMRKLV